MPRSFLAPLSLTWYLVVLWGISRILGGDVPHHDIGWTDETESVAATSLSEPAALAMLVLSRADHFTSAAVGIGGMLPPEVLAWRIIADQDDASTRFRLLSQSLNLATAAFGAAGLAYVDPGKVEMLWRARSHEWKRLVSTVSGCTRMDREFGELLEEIMAGSWWGTYLQVPKAAAAT